MFEKGSDYIHYTWRICNGLFVFFFKGGKGQVRYASLDAHSFLYLLNQLIVCLSYPRMVMSWPLFVGDKMGPPIQRTYHRRTYLNTIGVIILAPQALPHNYQLK